MTRKIQKLTWVKDASLQYEWAPGGVPAVTDHHEFDAILHVFVVYTDGTTEEWSDDWGKGIPPHLLDHIDRACKALA